MKKVYEKLKQLVSTTATIVRNGKKIIKSLNKELKEIKVTGQGCLNDCKVWHEGSGQNYYHA